MTNSERENIYKSFGLSKEEGDELIKLCNEMFPNNEETQKRKEIQIMEEKDYVVLHKIILKLTREEKKILAECFREASRRLGRLEYSDAQKANPLLHNMLLKMCEEEGTMQNHLRNFFCYMEYYVFSDNPFASEFATEIVHTIGNKRRKTDLYYGYITVKIRTKWR